MVPSTETRPLLLDDGSTFSELVVSAERKSLRFADGSRIELSSNTTLTALASTSTDMILMLKEGRARFSVVPGGPRRWIVELGFARVEVVGTVFTAERDAEEVRISVSRGAVLVRSALLVDEVQRVNAGDNLRLARRPVEELPALESAEPAASEPRPASSSDALEPSSRSHSTSVTPQSVSQRPTTSAVEATPPVVVDALLREADSARIAGDFSRAERVLARIVQERPDDSRAPLAAFSRGVLQLHRLGQPRHAITSFEQALALGASRSLREDCYLRWLEAEVRLGRAVEARTLLARYDDEFPRGRHHVAMARLVEKLSPTK